MNSKKIIDKFLENEFKTGKMKCGGLFELGSANKTVFITSPYYPGQYPTNVICNYYVTVRSNKPKKII